MLELNKILNLTCKISNPTISAVIFYDQISFLSLLSLNTYERYKPCHTKTNPSLSDFFVYTHSLFSLNFSSYDHIYKPLKSGYTVYVTHKKKTHTHTV